VSFHGVITSARGTMRKRAGVPSWCCWWGCFGSCSTERVGGWAVVPGSIPGRFIDETVRGAALVVSPAASSAITGGAAKHERSGMQLQLPWPPTVNSYYGGGTHGRRYVTHKGKAFCERVVDICEQHNVQQITHGVAVIARMHPPDKRKRDVDNYWKALLDAMTAGRVWDDDSRVRLQVGEMLEPVRGGLVVVTVIGYDGDAAQGLRAMLAGIANSEADEWEV